VDDRDAFSSYFIAEVMDSMMCSTESRGAFAAAFPNTFALFSKPDSPSEEANESEGFSLSAQAATTRPSPASDFKPNPSELRGAVTKIANSSSSSTQSSFPVQGATNTGRTIFDEDTGKRWPIYQKDNDWFYQKDDGKIRQTPVHTEMGTMYDVNSFAAPKRISMGSFVSPTSSSGIPTSPIPRGSSASKFQNGVVNNLVLPAATRMAYYGVGKLAAGPFGGFVAKTVGPPSFTNWLTRGYTKGGGLFQRPR
jgi:hypothetical protein